MTVIAKSAKAHPAAKNQNMVVVGGHPKPSLLQHAVIETKQQIF